MKTIFAEPPILAFKRSKNLRNIDNKKILNGKKFNKGKCKPWFTRSINPYCEKIKTYRENVNKWWKV